MKSLATAYTLAVMAGGTALMAKDPASMFAYDRRRPADLVTAGAETRGSAVVTDLTHQTLTGTRRAAYLVTPSTAAPGPHPAILFVH